LYSSWIPGIDGVPQRAGWFGYRRSQARRFSAGSALDGRSRLLDVGPGHVGIGGSTTSAINFIVTILNLRDPGMTLMRMPVFVGMMLVVAFRPCSRSRSVPEADSWVLRPTNGGSSFFQPQHGGDPLVPALLWLFGHPSL